MGLCYGKRTCLPMKWNVIQFIKILWGYYRSPPSFHYVVMMVRKSIVLSLDNMEIEKKWVPALFTSTTWDICSVVMIWNWFDISSCPRAWCLLKVLGQEWGWIFEQKETHLDRRVPLRRGGGPPHVVVEISRLRELVLLLWHLDSRILCLFQLSTFFCGALFSPTDLN